MENVRISLEAARVNAKMRQDEAAAALNISVQTLINWEKGRTQPTIQQARAISELYGMPIGYIFYPQNQI